MAWYDGRMEPRPVRDLRSLDLAGLAGLVSDLDDTLTHQGRIVPAALTALARARDAGLRTVLVTGRPAGWVDHLARMWPVDGVVGENGGLWAAMVGGRLRTTYVQDTATRARNRARLDALAEAILTAVPGCALSADQPWRALDLAVDFCEDVAPLPDADAERIRALFAASGAKARVSSIHVNGWFGDFDKRAGLRSLVAALWGEDLDATAGRWAWFGDSPNDEPLFAAFPLSVGVANVRRFLPNLDHPPAWVTDLPGGHGFAEAVEHILANLGQVPEVSPAEEVP